MQEDFASLCKIIDKKDHLLPNFPLPIETKKSFPPLIVYPPPPSLTPPTLLKRQIGASLSFYGFSYVIIYKICNLTHPTTITLY